MRINLAGIRKFLTADNADITDIQKRGRYRVSSNRILQRRRETPSCGIHLCLSEPSLGRCALCQIAVASPLIVFGAIFTDFAGGRRFHLRLPWFVIL